MRAETDRTLPRVLRRCIKITVKILYLCSQQIDKQLAAKLLAQARLLNVSPQDAWIVLSNSSALPQAARSCAQMQFRHSRLASKRQETQKYTASLTLQRTR